MYSLSLNFPVFPITIARETGSNKGWQWYEHNINLLDYAFVISIVTFDYIHSYIGYIHSYICYIHSYFGYIHSYTTLSLSVTF